MKNQAARIVAKLLSAGLIVTAALPLSGAPASATTAHAARPASGAPLFAADFGSAPLPWTAVSGTFDTNDRVFHSNSLDPAAPLCRAVVGDRTWTDYTIEARLKLEHWTKPNADFGLIAGYQDPANYYLVLFQRKTGKLVIERKQNGKVHTLAEAPFAVTPGRWFTIRVSLAADGLVVA